MHLRLVQEDVLLEVKLVINANVRPVLKYGALVQQKALNRKTLTTYLNKVQRCVRIRVDALGSDSGYAIYKSLYSELCRQRRVHAEGAENAEGGWVPWFFSKYYRCKGLTDLRLPGTKRDSEQNLHD